MRSTSTAFAALVLSVLVSSGAAAQRARFPATDEQVAAALCAGRHACRVDFVLSAGRHAATPLAVVRVRVGRGCVDERGYRDELVAFRGGTVHRLRTLVIGREPCLEWQLSSWRFEGGELLFEHGMMGAPIALPPDTSGRTVLHIRPWPVRIVSATDGDRVLPTPPTPARGPLEILSME